jgi:hypothetical protein
MRRTFLALLLLGAATPALAQMPPAPLPEGTPMMPGERMRAGLLMRADANGDGTVTRAEALAAADTRFDRLDTDRDGTLTPEETRAAREAMRGSGGEGPPPPPPATDGVRPGPPRPIARTMTREESRTRALEAFARADTNGDGTVDQAELAQLRPMRGPGARGDRPTGDVPPPPPQD